MATKILLTTIFMGVITLSGCGNNAQQAAPDSKTNGASANTPAVPEVTTVIADEKIQSIGPDLLASAQRTDDTCSLDSVDGNYSKDQGKLAKGKPHIFRGWLLDKAKHPAGQFNVVLKGAQSFAIQASTGVARADVGDFFKNPTLSNAGFNFSSTLNPVQVGKFHVIYLTKNLGQAYLCDTGKTLIIE